MVTAVGVWGRVAYAVGGRRDPRPAVSAGDAYGDGRRPPPPVHCFRALFLTITCHPWWMTPGAGAPADDERHADPPGPAQRGDSEPVRARLGLLRGRIRPGLRRRGR